MGLCPGLLASSMGSQDGVAATPCAETKHRDICIQLSEMGSLRPIVRVGKEKKPPGSCLYGLSFSSIPMYLIRDLR